MAARWLSDLIGTLKNSFSIGSYFSSIDNLMTRKGAGSLGSDAPNLELYKSRGSIASPTAVAYLDTIAETKYKAYVGSTATFVELANIYVRVIEAPSDEADGISGEIVFNARKKDATLYQNKFNIGHDVVYASALAFYALRQVERFEYPSYSSSMTLNADTYGNFDITLTGDLTLDLDIPADAVAEWWSQKVIVRLRQDGTGSRLLTFGTSIELPDGLTGFALSTGANKIDYLSFLFDHVSSKWHLVSFVLGHG